MASASGRIIAPPRREGVKPQAGKTPWGRGRVVLAAQTIFVISSGAARFFFHPAFGRRKTKPGPSPRAILGVVGWGKRNLPAVAGFFAGPAPNLKLPRWGSLEISRSYGPRLSPKRGGVVEAAEKPARSRRSR